MSLSAAIHESAHAVIARKLGLSCGKVTLEPSRSIRSLAHAEIAHRWYPNRGAGTRQECDEAYVIALYAGHEADRALCSKEEHNDTHDREDAASVLGDAVHLEAQLRRKALALVREHSADIELVATALLERRTLYGAEVHVMLGMDA